MQLVHEEHDVARGFHLLDDVLQPLLELAAVFRVGEQQTQLQRHHALILESLGDVTLDDQPGEALSDGCLTDAGVAHQARVRFASTHEDAKDALHLLVAPEHGIEFTRACLRAQIHAALRQRAALLLLAELAARADELLLLAAHLRAHGAEVDVEIFGEDGVRAARDVAGHRLDELAGGNEAIARGGLGIVGDGLEEKLDVRGEGDETVGGFVVGEGVHELELGDARALGARLSDGILGGTALVHRRGGVVADFGAGDEKVFGLELGLAELLRLVHPILHSLDGVAVEAIEHGASAESGAAGRARDGRA